MFGHAYRQDPERLVLFGQDKEIITVVVVREEPGQSTWYLEQESMPGILSPYPHWEALLAALYDEFDADVIKHDEAGHIIPLPVK